jgi:hypothetical protein
MKAMRTDTSRAEDLMRTLIAIALAASFALAATGWTKDLDDADGVKKTGQAKPAKRQEEVVVTPDGKKIYIDHENGTWRDDSGRKGKADKRR